MRPLVLALVIAVLAPTVVALPTFPQQYWKPGDPEPDPEMGPDVPASPLPLATVVVFDDEVWSFTQGWRTKVIDVPTGWTRVVIDYRQKNVGDPWDRLFQVFFGQTEVLRGTTPRTDFTVSKDMTRYAALLPQGGKASISADTSEWVGGQQHVWVTLKFYDDATSGLVEAPHDHVVPVYASGGMCKGAVISRPVAFPEARSSAGVLEFFATNHADEEGYVAARHFQVYVDGQLLTTMHTFPYRYAWIGFGGPQPYNNDVVHPVMWWSAFRALDVAGVHTGPGEIPPYRLQLNETQLDALVGAKTVEVRAKSVYHCVWITSLAFLLDE